MNLLFDYIIALTNLNGVIDKEKVVEIYNMQNEDKRNVSDIDLVMSENEKELRTHFVEVEGRYFVHEAVFTFGEAELLLQKKGDKPYYIPEKKVLLRYKDNEFYEETNQTKKLYRFLEKYVQPDNVNSVEDVFYDVLTYCQMEAQPAEVINRLQQIGVTFPTKKVLTEAMHIIIEFSNHTRLWSNNGFTPAEMSGDLDKPHLKPLPAEDFAFNSANNQSAHYTKKVGRNEPCPCGSGKKYKKCCLLNQ